MYLQFTGELYVGEEETSKHHLGEINLYPNTD